MATPAYRTARRTEDRRIGARWRDISDAAWAKASEWQDAGVTPEQAAKYAADVSRGFATSDRTKEVYALAAEMVADSAKTRATPAADIFSRL